MRSGDCPQCLHEKGAVWLPPKKQILLASQQYDHFCGYDFDPRYLPGCVYFGCTNTAAFGSGAVGFPADPLVNGNFEGAAGPPPASWGQWNCTATREAGTRTGGSGSFVGRAAWDGANAAGGLTQTAGTVGNTYDYAGWYRTDGAAHPRIWDGGITAWTGTATATWTPFSFSKVMAGATWLGSYDLAATRWVEYDDVTITPRNASQLTDLSGAGHHLLQATLASQPLWVASGSGGVLRFTAGSDYLKTAAFTLNQPEHVFVLAKWTKQADARYLIDGNATNSMGIYHGAVVARADLYSTAAGYNGANFTNAAWGTIDAVFNAASSAVGYNGGSVVTGTVGATNAGGVTLCTVGGGTAGFCPQADIAAAVVYDRALAEADRQRVIRWLNRQKAFLAL